MSSLIHWLPGEEETAHFTGDPGTTGVVVEVGRHNSTPRQDIFLERLTVREVPTSFIDAPPENSAPPERGAPQDGKSLTPTLEPPYLQATWHRSVRMADRPKQVPAFGLGFKKARIPSQGGSISFP